MSVLLRKYLGLVGKRVLRRDVSQIAVAERLDELLNDLSYHKAALTIWGEEKEAYVREFESQAERVFQLKLEQQRTQRDAFSSHSFEDVAPSAGESGAGPTRRRLRTEALAEAENIVGPPPKRPLAPKSVYLHGEVGAGKTFLLDLFYQDAREILEPSGSACRMHFNSAMLELHQHMHRIEKEYYERDKFKVRNPGKLAVIAARRRNSHKAGGHRFGAAGAPFTVSTTLDLASRELFDLESSRPASLVCFDELQVPDGFTAISIMSMFRTLFKEESVVVSTSNCAPEELNDQAWFSDHYDQFTEMILDKCEVIRLECGVDYRRVLLSKCTDVEKFAFARYFHPHGERSTDLLRKQVEKIKCLYETEDLTQVGSSPDSAQSRRVDVMFGRTLEVPTEGKHIAKIDFMDFFSKPVGPTDCLAVAKSFPCVCITGIPVLSRQKRDQARRFITMVDELYNEGCLLVCTAEASPDTLFKSDELGESLLDLEALQFEAEALTDAKSRVDSTLAGGVSPRAATQRMSEERKFFAKKMTGEEEQFAFKRAVSRIMEMQGEAWATRHRKLRIKAADATDVVKASLAG